MTTRRCLLAPLIALLLTACGSTTVMPPPAKLPPKTVIAPVPFYPDDGELCGPTALATALGAAGLNADPETLKSLVYLPQRQGSLAIEMKAAARGSGALPYVIAPSMDALFTELAAGNPVLVLQNLGLSWRPKWHYAVVIGYDLRAGHFLLRSGTTANLTMPFPVFSATWERADQWGMTLLPPGRMAASADPQRWRDMALELERANQWQSALAAWQSAVTRWPEDSIAAFGLGNTAMALQQTETAVTAYSAALWREADHSPVWNNMAYALQASGCADAALAAAQCAYALSPNANTAGTLHDMRRKTGIHCAAPPPRLPVCPTRN